MIPDEDLRREERSVCNWAAAVQTETWLTPPCVVYTDEMMKFPKFAMTVTLRCFTFWVSGTPGVYIWTPCRVHCTNSFSSCAEPTYVHAACMTESRYNNQATTMSWVRRPFTLENLWFVTHAGRVYSFEQSCWVIYLWWFRVLNSALPCSVVNGSLLTYGCLYCVWIIYSHDGANKSVEQCIADLWLCMVLNSALLIYDCVGCWTVHCWSMVVWGVEQYIAGLWLCGVLNSALLIYGCVGCWTVHCWSMVVWGVEQCIAGLWLCGVLNSALLIYDCVGVLNSALLIYGCVGCWTSALLIYGCVGCWTVHCWSMVVWGVEQCIADLWLCRVLNSTLLVYGCVGCWTVHCWSMVVWGVEQCIADLWLCRVLNSALLIYGCVGCWTVHCWSMVV